MNTIQFLVIAYYFVVSTLLIFVLYRNYKLQRIINRLEQNQSNKDFVFKISGNDLVSIVEGKRKTEHDQLPKTP